jgi:hypothetical protein
MTNSIRKKLQIGSAALILFSALPCLLATLNVVPVIQGAIHTGENYSLQILFPLCSASLVNGLGLVLLIISLTMKDRQPEGGTNL